MDKRKSTSLGHDSTSAKTANKRTAAESSELNSSGQWVTILNEDIIEPEVDTDEIGKEMKRTVSSWSDVERNATAAEIDQVVAKKKMKKRNHSDEAIERAFLSIGNECKSLAAAARKYNIPESTLRDKLSGKAVIKCKRGPPPLLTQMAMKAGIDVDFDEELHVYFKDQARRGFAVTTENLRVKVQHLIEREKKKNANIESPFPGNIPGRKFAQSFLARHSDLNVKTLENSSLSKAALTDGKIRFWFKELYDYFTEMELLYLLNCPERNLNADELSFSICESTGNFVEKKGEGLQNDNLIGDDKENYTLMLTISADGVLCPPTLIFEYQTFPANVAITCPDGWQYLRSEHGWMTGETFCQYLVHLHEFLVKKDILDPTGNTRKVLLYVDGHSSHVDMQAADYCLQNGIILVCVVSNATHLCQPLDVGVKGPLKKNLANVIQKHKASSGERVKKHNIASKFLQTLSLISEESIQNSFHRCSLFPFDVAGPDFTNLYSQGSELNENNSVTSPCFLTSPLHHPLSINSTEESGSSNDQQNFQDRSEILETQVSAFNGFKATCKQFLPPSIFSKMESNIKNRECFWTGETKYQGLFEVWVAAIRQVEGDEYFDAKPSGLDDIESSSAQEEGCDSNFISVEAETLPRKSLDSQNAGGSKLPSKNNGLKAGSTTRRNKISTISKAQPNQSNSETDLK